MPTLKTLMPEPIVLQQLYDISFAIFSLDYDAVDRYLADESFPVNFYFPRFKKLPKDLAIESMDLRIIVSFLDALVSTGLNPAY